MDALKWFSDRHEEIFDDFFSYLKFASVSTDSSHKGDLESCADWLRRYLLSMGLSVDVWQESGSPILFAHHLVDKNAPTLLFYGHYDVQPADPIDLWKRDPFDPVIVDGRVYCRGAQDNKGQSFYTIVAIKAFLESSLSSRINIKLVIEGEEEIGSGFLFDCIKSKKRELSSDYTFIVDCGMGSPDNPSVTIGARGIMSMEVICKTIDTDVHSGSMGGIVYNPARVLVDLLSKCVDSEGVIQIPHFYDDVAEFPNKSDVDTHFCEEEYRKNFGIKVFHREKGFTPIESNFFRPTFEINGLSSGYFGKGFKTVIGKDAMAKISCRLVAFQDPKKIFSLVERFIRDQVPRLVDLKIILMGAATASLSSPASPSVKAMKQAFVDTFGKCNVILAGGSVPITGELGKLAQHSFVMTGTGMEMDNIHAPNESFGIDQFRWGFQSIYRVLNILSVQSS